MKTYLSIAQSARLIELGVDPKLASGEQYVESGETRDGIELPSILQPMFSLANILAMLPKQIKYNGEPYGFNMAWDANWEASYFNVVNFITPNKEGSIAFEQGPELIDALYQLLIWCIENGHYNSKSKDK